MADDVSDEICDSWEDMIENGVLEKKLEELKVKSSVNVVGDHQNKMLGLVQTPMRLEDSSRTQYVIAVPQVKILKRPSDAKLGHLGHSDKSPSKQPPKTLEQREAEYAQARLRILGSAKHEETYENPLTIANLSGVSTNEVPAAGGLGATMPPSAAPASASLPLPVIRQPKGPDGTKGFVQQR